MKICWENLEKLRLSSGKDVLIDKHWHKYEEKVCVNCGELFLGRKKDNNCSQSCAMMNRRVGCQNIWRDENGIILKKRCFSCNEILNVEFFNKERNNIPRAYCRFCDIKNKKRYYSSEALFDISNEKVSVCEKTRRSTSNKDILEVTCSVCGNWFIPTNQQICNRLSFLEGRTVYENKLYCSESCKKNCSVFQQRKFPKWFKKNVNRTTQSELRQLCLERDNFECIKCGCKENLICHHIEGIVHNPLESSDLDMVVVLCNRCHEYIHSQKGCTRIDFQCKGG